MGAGKKTNKSTDNSEDFQSFINQQGSKVASTTQSFFKQSNNSRAGSGMGHKKGESFDVSSRNNLDRAMIAYNTAQQNKQQAFGSHKRSASN